MLWFLFVSGFTSAVYISLKSAHSSLTAEKDRLKLAIDLQGPQPPQVMGLKTSFASVSNIFCTIPPSLRDPLTHFSELQTLYQECSAPPQSLVHQASSESRASIPDSISEFFDAQEYLLSSSSSENEVGPLSHVQNRMKETHS